MNFEMHKIISNGLTASDCRLRGSDNNGTLSAMVHAPVPRGGY